MNIKLGKEIASIVGTDTQQVMQKRVAWVKASDQRNAFLQELRDRNINSKAYSDAVVRYDRDHMQVFSV